MGSRLVCHGATEDKSLMRDSADGSSLHAQPTRCCCCCCRHKPGISAASETTRPVSGVAAAAVNTRVSILFRNEKLVAPCCADRWERIASRPRRGSRQRHLTSRHRLPYISNREWRSIPASLAGRHDHDDDELVYFCLRRSSASALRQNGSCIGARLNDTPISVCMQPPYIASYRYGSFPRIARFRTSFIMRRDV